MCKWILGHNLILCFLSICEKLLNHGWQICKKKWFLLFSFFLQYWQKYFLPQQNANPGYGGNGYKLSSKPDSVFCTCFSILILSFWFTLYRFNIYSLQWLLVSLCSSTKYYELRYPPGPYIHPHYQILSGKKIIHFIVFHLSSTFQVSLPHFC